MTNERIAEKYNSRTQPPGPFSAADSFRVNSNAVRAIELLANEKTYKVQVKYVGTDYEIKVDDTDWVPCSVQQIVDSNPNRFTLKLNSNGVQSTYSAFIDSNSIDIFNEVSFPVSCVILENVFAFHEIFDSIAEWKNGI